MGAKPKILRWAKKKQIVLVVEGHDVKGIDIARREIGANQSHLNLIVEASNLGNKKKYIVATLKFISETSGVIRVATLGISIVRVILPVLPCLP